MQEKGECSGLWHRGGAGRWVQCSRHFTSRASQLVVLHLVQHVGGQPDDQAPADQLSHVQLELGVVVLPGPTPGRHLPLAASTFDALESRALICS